MTEQSKNVRVFMLSAEQARDLTPEKLIDFGRQAVQGAERATSTEQLSLFSAKITEVLAEAAERRGVKPHNVLDGMFDQ